MTGRMIARVVYILLCVAFSACGGSRLSLDHEPRTFTPDDYEDVFSAWTKSADPYSFGDLSDVLHVTATYESPEFTWAYTVRYAADHGLSLEERDALLHSNVAQATSQHRFFVTLAGHDWRSSDLTSDRSAWRALLVDEQGRATAPTGMEKIEHPTPADRVYFPSIAPTRQTFRLTFPARLPDGTETIPARTRKVVLRFTGAEGKVDLHWDIAPSN